MDINVFLQPGAAYIFKDSALPQNVSIRGRVLDSNGRGVFNAYITFTKENGETLTRPTTTSGYYQFSDIDTGQTVKIEVKSKRYNFAPQIISVTDNLAELNFTPN